MFLTFNSQEERRKYGSSAFIEISFCDLSPKTTIKRRVNLKNIQYWKNDSLYVYLDDIQVFCQEYAHIFGPGADDNETGVFDAYGVNYYAPDLIDPLIKKIENEKPVDYQIITEWLSRAKSHNGFYILGI